MSHTDLPISTGWLLDASDFHNKEVITTVYLIYCPKTKSKGTGFLLRNGIIVTNWHVIKDCSANEVLALSSLNKQIEFASVKFDANRDIALLFSKERIHGGLEIDNSIIKTETKVITWGHPLAYNGPAPILSVGYIAGFKDHKKASGVVRHYIINGALNPGNSGGPLLIQGTEKIVGIVVAKHAPITPFLQSALQALANQKAGLIYSASDENGNSSSLSEGQIVSMLLQHQRMMTQVMLGEAVASAELISYLKELSL
jgi:hypothetical protein